ncbi:decaprenyl-phosphate phosphoribosyltransferase [Enterovibrio calviensis]|uniref:decaprenyl-phosphate phosphoribosyltransferase n=1 Tax=Enterovibrio calviensis TaxID=91359 RepID=UPI003736D63A
MKLLRPKQWVKNTFVFMPLIFSGQIVDPESIIRAVYSFLFFCLASSAVYIVNDYRDMEKDRLHPLKSKSRPLANGSVSIQLALIVVLVFYVIISLSYFLNSSLFLTLFSYIILNYIYSFCLKDKPIWDIFCIATGFVLRVLCGAVAISVTLSSWMFITTFSIALYLASIKRKQELNSTGSLARVSLTRYNTSIVEKFAEISATCALIFYSIFAFSNEKNLVLTIPLVMFGIFRYWYLVEFKNDGESPTDTLLSDIQLVSVILVWLILCSYIILV